MKYKKKLTGTAIASAALIAVSFAMSGLSGSLESQNMAERWQAGSLKYAQVSVFYPQSSTPYKETETENIGKFIDDRIKAESFKPENEGAEIWTDAWSSVMTPSAVSVYNPESGRTDECASKINIAGIGGDFFSFHPLNLVSGNYIYETELRNDRAVLDEKSAWAIFSSTDVTGMTFRINGKEFEVAGVVRSEEDKSSQKSYPEEPVIYIHYEALEETGLDDALLCYESVIPDPVDNFAANVIKEYFGISTMTEPVDGKDPVKSLPVVITENSSRYSLLSLFKGLKNFDSQFISDRSIAYPYWENAARITGVQMEILFFIALILSVYILVMVAVMVSGLYLNRKWHLKDHIENLMYKYTYKKKTSDYISVDENESDTESRFD